MWSYPEIDPIAFSIGPLTVHWYGLAYLLAFVTAWTYGLYNARQSWSSVKVKQVEDLIFYGAVGVVIGGRAGYVMFYDFAAFLDDPLWLFRLWEGGMSFHGGLVGVIVATLIYARKIDQPFLRVMDFLAPLVPPGLFFGRLGNFIGQELWGRETTSNWGMVFPRDPEQLLRHPSQLYEAFLEGIMIFLILFWFSRKQRPVGATSALFVTLYGVFRFSVEFFREPDAHIQFDLFDWVTRGQILSTPMIVVGLIVLIWSYSHSSKKQA